MSLLDRAIEEMVKTTVKEELAKPRHKTTEKGDRPWNRENAKWEPGEEEILVQRVSIFIDNCALAHRRKRGGILARLNKLIASQKLCGLRESAPRRSMSK